MYIQVNQEPIMSIKETHILDTFYLNGDLCMRISPNNEYKVLDLICGSIRTVEENTSVIPIDTTIIDTAQLKKLEDIAKNFID